MKNQIFGIFGRDIKIFCDKNHGVKNFCFGFSHLSIKISRKGVGLSKSRLLPIANYLLFGVTEMIA